MNKLKFKLYEKFNGSSLDFLDVGDVIWANRYVNLDDKENFEIGHEKGPFVIIVKNVMYWQKTHILALIIIWK